MPYISIECVPLPKAQKDELMIKMTQLASEITHIPKEYFLVAVKELPAENIAMGGMSIAKMKSAKKQHTDK